MKLTTYILPDCLLSRSTTAAALTIAATFCFSIPARAQVVTLTASDTSGTSSFNSAGNWDDGFAPSSGKDYNTGAFILRTPDGGADYTFAGDSLTIGNRMDLIGTGLVTVNDLRWDGMNLLTSLSNAYLAGNINVLASSSIFATRTNYHISAALSGSATLSLTGWQQNNFPGYRVGFSSPDSTFTGNINVSDGHLWLEDDSRMNFVIGANGVNNSIYGSNLGTSGGSNTASVATFDGDFHFDLTGASTIVGDTWSIANVIDQTFGETFTVDGFTQSGNLWTSGDGNYQFDTNTGNLSVIPESASFALLLALSSTLLVVRRRSRS